LFALGPFLSAALALAVVAMILGGSESFAEHGATLAATTALISFGPHEWFDASFAAIWPAVVLAQFACAVLIVRVFAPMLHGRARSAGQAS